MEVQKVEEVTEPVSPVGQYFNSSVLSISILGVLESEVPIDDSPTLPLLKDLFLPINPRFSSIMVIVIPSFFLLASQSALLYIHRKHFQTLKLNTYNKIFYVFLCLICFCLKFLERYVNN